MSAVQAPQSQAATRSAMIGVAPLAAAAAVLAAARQGGMATAVLAAFVAAVVVALAAIDLRRRIIPNRIVLPATAIVLALRFAFLSSHALRFVEASLLTALALLVLNVLTRSGIGMGDVKFGLLIGAALGQGAIAALTAAFLAICPVAVVVLIRGGLSARKAWLPLGPFLAFGSLLVVIGPGITG